MYKLIWDIPLEIIGDFHHPDDSTVGFNIIHRRYGKTYTIVGRWVVEEFFLDKPYSTVLSVFSILKVKIA